MTVLSDKWIKKAALKGMIKPFVNKQIRKGKIFCFENYLLIFFNFLTLTF